MAATPSASEGPAAQGLDTSTSPSNALYDRCAPETDVRDVSPIASKRAGQRAMRLLEGPTPVAGLAIKRSRLSPRGGATFLLVRGRIVGLGGVEPPTLSLSAIGGSPLCNPAFSQVATNRQGRSNAFLAISI